MLKSFHVSNKANIILFIFLMCVLFTIISAKKYTHDKKFKKLSSKTAHCFQKDQVKKFFDKMNLKPEEQNTLIDFLDFYIKKHLGKVNSNKIKHFLKFIRRRRKRENTDKVDISKPTLNQLMQLFEDFDADANSNAETETDTDADSDSDAEDKNENFNSKESDATILVNAKSVTQTSMVQNTQKSIVQSSSVTPTKSNANSKKTKTKNEISKKENDMKRFDNAVDHCLLKKIAQQLEDLKDVASPLCGKEGLPCYPNGTWSAERAGVLLRVHLSQNFEKVKIYNRIPPKPPHKKFLSCHWDMEAHSPFPSLGYLVLYATLKQNKNVAAFIGQCKICGGTEVVMGNWLIDRGARDCKHMAASQLVIGDIFRRVVSHRNNMARFVSEKKKFKISQKDKRLLLN